MPDIFKGPFEKFGGGGVVAAAPSAPSPHTPMCCGPEVTDLKYFTLNRDLDSKCYKSASSVVVFSCVLFLLRYICIIIGLFVCTSCYIILQ